MAASRKNHKRSDDFAEELRRLFGGIDRRLSAALVLRAALRNIPLVPIFAANKITLLFAVLRLCSTVHYSLKYDLTTSKKEIFIISDTIEELTGTVTATTISPASLISSILHGTKDEWQRLAVSSLEAMLASTGSHSFFTSKHRSDRYDNKAVTDAVDAFYKDVAIQQSGVSPSQLVGLPLWPQGESPLPKWIVRPWKNLSKDLLARGVHWQVWIDWYNALLLGPTGNREGPDWDAAFFSQASGDQLPWDEGPRAVNEKIAERLASKGRGLPQTNTLFVAHQSEDVDAFSQRPSSYFFEWKNGRLEAVTIHEIPFNVTLAQHLAAEIVRKVQEAFHVLRGNNADEVVQRSLERVLAVVRRPVDRIPEGILLSRFNTLAAHARAYNDVTSGREREIRARIDDVAASVGNLVDCYPNIRAINANRIALDMQAEHAQEVETELRAIIEFAHGNPAVGDTARSALETGHDEVDDLTSKIDHETSVSKAAGYVIARGQAVAARVADVANFTSATLKQASAELSGLRDDTWREIRKKVPKATATGIAKGAERATQEGLATFGKLPIVALAYWIAGPIAAITVLIPRLGAHRRKADQLKQKIEDGIQSPK